MENNAAVVSVSDPEKVIWSGSWLECSKFIRNNTWLYGDKLFIRRLSTEGLGEASLAHLWNAI